MKNPINELTIAVIQIFPNYKVKANTQITTVDTDKRVTNISLYFEFLSKIVPKTAHPINPVTINNTPNKELSA
jgi:hypothetical protein